MRELSRLGQLFWATLLAASAHASDGVLEINLACATATGCFAGDLAGLPVTITAAAPARSFRLTSDLTTASGAQTMISVSVPSVTIDLGGFRIAGPAVCSGVPVTSCTNGGAGQGVTGGNDVTVKNGSITGMGNTAVSLTYSARVEGLNVFHCGGGITATDLAVIRGNIVTSGGGDGIRCRDHCVVSENSATGHFGDGIDVAIGTVNGNSASLNGGAGGRFGSRVAYAQNQFSGNAVADVVGGHASSGNLCADASCSARGTRRFYLTQSAHNGTQAVLACAVGFHFASMWELQDPSHLEYDVARGVTSPDAGLGPPTSLAEGWIRTGRASTSSNGRQGVDNCNAWSSSSGQGTVAGLDTAGNWLNGWDTVPQSRVEPWDPDLQNCSDPKHVWCVED